MKILSRLLPLLCLCFLLGCSSADPVATDTAATQVTEPVTQPTAEPTTVPTTEPQPQHFTLTFAGDCTFGGDASKYSDPYSFYALVGEDYGYPFRNVIEYFENDDFSMVNLEGPLTEQTKGAVKTHVFRGPTRFVNILTQNSIEAVTLANNHTLDYFQEGYDDTVATLEDAGVFYAEAGVSTVFRTESGLNIGVYAVTYKHIDSQEICQAISALKADPEVDLVIFAPHWGTEYTYTPILMHRQLARDVIDAGADIVFGTHPHVLQPIEYYADGVIFYSLGNFSFGGSVFPEDFDTALVQVEVIRDPDGSVSLGEITAVPCNLSSVTVTNNYQPTPYDPDSYEYRRTMDKLDGSKLSKY